MSTPDPVTDPWLEDLRAELRALESRDLLRGLPLVELDGPRLRRGGRWLVNLAGNDYLGLSTHPTLREAAAAATREAGTGTGASRVLSGHTPIHAAAEAAFAAFKHAEAALLLPTGYTANLAALTALAGPGDLICLDKLCHASLIDAARASGAEVRVFPHLNTEKLDWLLSRPRRDSAQASEADAGDDTGEPHPAPRTAARPARRPRKLIVTDSVFSMDADAADLPALCELADAHGAIVVADEAHGTGVLGPTGAGLAEAQGVAARIDVTISTGSKALGGLGGIVTARREVIATLINRARPFIYSTGVPAAQAAALTAALSVVRGEPWRRERLAAHSRAVWRAVRELDWLPPGRAATAPDLPIVPLATGTPRSALDLAGFLAERGFYAAAIRPPTVAPGSSRVRLSLRADLEESCVAELVNTLHAYRDRSQE